MKNLILDLPGSLGARWRGAHDPRPARCRVSRLTSWPSAGAAAGGPAHLRVGPVCGLISDPEFLCPITMEAMTDPVFAADGHVYDRASIESFLETHDTSPLTNEPLATKSLTPNDALRSRLRERARSSSVTSPFKSLPGRGKGLRRPIGRDSAEVAGTPPSGRTRTEAVGGISGSALVVDLGEGARARLAASRQVRPQAK